jgi:hypothetical protein
MFTAKQKLEALQRELGYRRRVYERRVEAGQMTRKEADYQLDIFEAIRDDYEKQEVAERLL